MKPEIALAVSDIRTAFPDCPVLTRDDGSGGALVIIENMELGPPYKQDTTWVGFHITFPYPYADVYPLFVRGDLARMDERPLGEATSPGSFEGRAAVQLSRRANRLNPVADTALRKLLKVMDWLRRRP
jgi:hypothetical protein